MTIYVILDCEFLELRLFCLHILLTCLFNDFVPYKLARLLFVTFFECLVSFIRSKGVKSVFSAIEPDYPSCREVLCVIIEPCLEIWTISVHHIEGLIVFDYPRAIINRLRLIFRGA